MAKKKRSPSLKAKKAYYKLLEKSYRRFQPGGKAFAALKKNHPTVVQGHAKF